MHSTCSLRAVEFVMLVATPQIFVALCMLAICMRAFRGVFAPMCSGAGLDAMHVLKCFHASNRHTVKKAHHLASRSDKDVD